MPSNTSVDSETARHQGAIRAMHVVAGLQRIRPTSASPSSAFQRRSASPGNTRSTTELRQQEANRLGQDARLSTMTPQSQSLASALSTDSTDSEIALRTRPRSAVSKPVSTPVQQRTIRPQSASARRATAHVRHPRSTASETDSIDEGGESRRVNRRESREGGSTHLVTQSITRESREGGSTHLATQSITTV